MTEKRFFEKNRDCASIYRIIRRLGAFLTMMQQYWPHKSHIAIKGIKNASDWTHLRQECDKNSWCQSWVKKIASIKNGVPMNSQMRMMMNEYS